MPQKKRDESFIRDVGAKINYYRELKGVSVKDLAEYCGLHEQTVYKYIAGQSNPSLRTLIRISKKLKVRISKFFALN